MVRYVVCTYCGLNVMWLYVMWSDMWFVHNVIRDVISQGGFVCHVIGHVIGHVLFLRKHQSVRDSSS